MLSSHFGNIFYYDNHQNTLSAFADIYEHQTYRTFGTNNIYQLLQYTKEIQPDVMILNLQNQENSIKNTVEHFEHDATVKNFPIIVLKSENSSYTPHPRVAHYINLPQDLNKLTEIIESYGCGQKTPHFMLLDTYSEKSDILHETLDRNNFSYFEVHNTDAAALYLQKNRPLNVLVEYMPQFIAARHTLNHQRIFYVDRHQLSAEIEKFLH